MQLQKIQNFYLTATVYNRLSGMSFRRLFGYSKNITYFMFSCITYFMYYCYPENLSPEILLKKKSILIPDNRLYTVFSFEQNLE